jgi:solute carrier family 25 (mitochondrial aspartate/glutamate transporter), member 12/13
MDEFTEALHLQQVENSSLPIMPDSLISVRLVKTYCSYRNPVNARPDDSETTRIYLSDFCFFHLLMVRADPEVDIAFLCMDEHHTGQIVLRDLVKFLLPVFPDLDFRSQFFQRYFGKDGRQSIRQTHFSQFLVDLQREIGKQAFLRAVERQGTEEGYLAPTEFVHVLQTRCGLRLPQGVSNRLENIYCANGTENGDKTAKQSAIRAKGDEFFAYGDFLAFQDVLGNLPFICNLIDRAQEIKKGPLSSDDFKVANRVLGLGGRLSRRQVEIVFNLFDLDRDGYITRQDTVDVCGDNYARRLIPMKGRGDLLTFAPTQQFRNEERRIAGEWATREKLSSCLFDFGIATLVGSVSVGLMYPASLIQTRLMNQRIGEDGVRMYRGAVDCFQQALRFEGYSGLYRGITPQILGVAPERTIKLQVHDLVKRAFSTDEDGGSAAKKTSLWLEAYAGACAGASQLLITNPTEILRIRLQMQGETTRLLTSLPSYPLTLSAVVKDLGFPGVYRGAFACLLRDIPFSAIYFPTYAALKETLVAMKGTTRKASSSDILLAGTLAGVPAAWMTTPADVIKSRLQTVPRPGEAGYSGIRDCATKIYVKEGISAFFLGSVMRVVRLAPQFGISLLLYEGLSDLLGFQRSNFPPTTLPLDPIDYRAAFPDRSSYFQGYFSTSKSSEEGT